MTFRATLSAAVSSDVVLGWSTGNDDTAGARQATSATDYTAVSNGSVTITANSTEATFTVQTTQDTATEGDETFKITITGTTLPTGVTIATASTIGTIEDDDTPTASDISKSTSEDTTLTFAATDFTGAFSDPDGHTLKSVKIVTLPDSAHGALKSGSPQAAVNAGDTIAAGDLGTLVFEPAANWNGSASFTFKVTGTDDQESIAAATVTITVTAVNNAPTASGISKSTSEDTTLTFAASDFTGAFSDPDGHTLKSVKIVTLPTAAHGALKAGSARAAVSAGDSIAVADLGTLVFEPVANWNGTASFTFKVTDTDDQESTAAATVTITVTAVDDAPTAVDDAPTAADDAPTAVDDAPTTSDISKSTNEDTTLTFTATDFTGAFNDPDGHTLKSVKIVTLPESAHGTLKSGSPRAAVSAGDMIAAAKLGTLVFEPVANWNGATSFTFKVTDSTDQESTAAATATITVTAVNDAPTASGISKSTSEDTTLTFAATDFTGAFNDPDGHTLKSVTIVTLPNTTHGALKSGSPRAAVSAGDTIAAADLGTLVFEPAANWNGTAGFTFKVTDATDQESAASATATITVTAVDDAPTASGITKGTSEDTTLKFAASYFTSAFSDPDGHTLKSVKIVTLPNATHGALKVGSPQAAVSAGDTIAAGDLGTLVFEPAANWNGTTSFTFKVTDSTDQESTAAATVTITVTAVDDTPTASGISKSTNEDTTLTFAAADFTGAFSDPDGRALKSVKIVTLPDAAHGALKAGSPPAAVSAGDTLAAADLGTLVFEPVANWNGTASFTFKVTDTADQESAAAATVTITVTAEAVTVSVQAGAATEGSAVTFKAKLSTAVGSAVVLAWVTADDDTAGALQATAGTDYTAETNGSVTITAGATEATFTVQTTADTTTEGDETFKVTISETTANPLPAGVTIATASAIATIENVERMPRAWLARFGRTLAEQVVAVVQTRLETPRRAGSRARIAGQELGAAGSIDADEAARQRDEALVRWLDGTPAEPRTMTARELLAGSGFALASAAGDSPSAALWGRGSLSRFDGREDELSVDGELTSVTLGADFAFGAWLAGVMATHVRGGGGYRGDGGAGTVAGELTGVFPFAGVDLSARLTAWAVAGLGLGGLTLTPEAAQALETDLTLALAALGARGRLVEPAAGSGFTLAIETDAYWVHTNAEAAPGLAAALADVTRIRLGLDGGYRLALAGGGTLEPTFEIGARHDGGHVETGYGMDLGGGLAGSAPSLGVSAELSARGLLAYRFDGFRQVGVSGSLAWDPDSSSDLGPSLSVRQTLGAAATGGMHALLGRETLAGLPATDDPLQSRRLDIRAGYGFAAFDDRFTATPEVGLVVEPLRREYRLGWRLASADPGRTSFEIGLDGIRLEHADQAASPEHTFGIRVTARW